MLNKTLLLVLLLALSLGAFSCDDGGKSRPGDLSGDVDAMDDSTDATPNDLTSPDFPDQVFLDVADTEPADTRADTAEDLRDSTSFEVSDVDPDAPLAPLQLDRVEPDFGPTSGENVVTLQGQGFTQDTEVYFGSSRSPAVVFANAHELSVVVPSGPVGTVPVKVLNEAGNDALGAAYTYVDPIRVDGVEPARSPTSGGVPFVLRGAGFDAETTVSIGSRSAIDVAMVDPSTLSGIFPPGTLGWASLRVTNSAGSTLVPNALEYTLATRLDAAFPAAGPTAGGTTVTLEGAGLAEVQSVLFGAYPASIQAKGQTQLTVTTPPQSAGVRDVVVSGPDGTARLSDGFFYYLPAAGPKVLGVVPSSGPTTGGNSVIIAGYGFDDPPTSASIGGAAVSNAVVVADSIRADAPAGALGAADVQVDTNGGSDVLVGGYRYTQPLAITQVSPALGPVAGGTTVTVNGAGFDSSTTVFFGALPASSVTLGNATRLTATTPPGSGGAVDVQVRRGTVSATLADGFFYTEALEVFALVPSRGSQAGGTTVTVAGKGFQVGATVTLDGLAATNVQRLDAYTLQFVTPAHEPGVVDVAVHQGADVVVSPDPFTFYDPGTRYGGGWGEGVAGNVNITVLTYGSNDPVEGAFVMLSTNTNTPYQGVTDVNGQLTFSGDDVLGTQTVSASKVKYSSANITTIDAENLTLYLTYLDAAQGEMPPQKAPGVISGNITGADKVGLITDPNKVRMTIVVTSQVDPFSPNPDPGSENQLSGDGFYRLQSRLGDVAVIGMCGVFDTVNGVFEPKYMALQRFLFVTEASAHTVNLNCNIRLDLPMHFKLIDSRLQEDPNMNMVIPYLYLGPEGYHGGYDVAEGDTDLVTAYNQAPLTGALAGMDYYLIGGSFTDGGTPYSLVQMEHVTDFSAPIEFGPLVGVPQMVTPTPSGVVMSNHFEWTQATPNRVDLYSITISEPTFPPKPIWEVYLPGAATSFDLPAFLSSSGAATPYSGLAYLEIEGVNVNRPFNFNTFSLRDLSLDRREAWVYKSIPILFL
ncbi:MAG: hypothetical protein CO108_21470 [Deltaproteobacteria bacterium CG_4_9_14_3_um_filter_63_12]|nr:MAG: hypothetical protein CO108_21470 [Deltaproteobacteria bacterium CG_4_9_14_3_um_filter_63_12]